ATGPVQVTFPGDGQYLLHYFAQDCAGTQELQFVLNPANVENPAPYWTTNFYTREINIDTTAPTVSAITLSPAGGTYKPGTLLTASYSCSDAPSGAGVVLCGTSAYGPETKYNTGTLKTQFRATGPMGGKTFTVYAADGAGNTSSSFVTYTVSN
ncbi:MAG: hypothetical protein WA802_01520, partial [Terracidiphilus sp.]